MYRDVRNLEKATQQAACIDVRAYFGTSERMIQTFDTKGACFNTLAIQAHTQDQYHINLSPGERMLIPTGIVLDIPEGYSVRVHPRSGLAFKKGLTLTNCEGIVDSDYTQQLYISVTNISQAPIRIEHEERIAQLEMVPQLTYNVETTDTKPEQKTNRNGGFGSTGK